MKLETQKQLRTQMDQMREEVKSIANQANQSAQVYQGSLTRLANERDSVISVLVRELSDYNQRIGYLNGRIEATSSFLDIIEREQEDEKKLAAEAEKRKAAEESALKDSLEEDEAYDTDMAKVPASPKRPTLVPVKPDTLG